MDIQRGDQVYYRGEVWTVMHVADLMYGEDTLTLHRKEGQPEKGVVFARPDQVQRVEQVR